MLRGVNPERLQRELDPKLSAWAVAAMIAVVAVPATFTLTTVRAPGKLEIPGADPTPFGYTWSLLLFIVPVTAIAVWFLRHEGFRLPRRAFWITISLLTLLGFSLDFLFASLFFTFNNAGATLGIPAPALGKPVPIEEYVFYFTGFLTTLLVYIWADEYWLAAYNVADYRAESQKVPRLLFFHPESAVVSGALLIGAIVYKRFFSVVHDGLPSYFIFLVLLAFIPSAGLFRMARPFINWRAFSFALFLILLISLLWEVTLGVPYGWWSYQEERMVGLFIGAWSNLPIEAVCVWIAVTYMTVIVFEVVKIWLASERKAKAMFLGYQAPPSLPSPASRER